MALIPWPVSLPQVPLWEFEAAPRAGLLDAEEGRNPRRTRTYPEHDSTFRFVLSLAQWRTLRAFYETDLNGGCAPFAAPWLPVVGYSHHYARFMEPPAVQSLGGGWMRATLRLEILATVPIVDEHPEMWPAGGVL